MERIWQYIFSKEQLQTFPEEVFFDDRQCTTAKDASQLISVLQPGFCDHQAGVPLGASGQ